MSPISSRLETNLTFNEILRHWFVNDLPFGESVGIGDPADRVVCVGEAGQRSLARGVKDIETRYCARKLVTLLGYVVAIAIVVTLFSERPGGFTVACGVAGAGIAFALQEVIASVAG